PEWLNRPEFIRGPTDRHERGRDRMFLGAEDAVPYLNYAEERYLLYESQPIPWTAAAGRAWFTRNVRWDRLGNYMGSAYQRLFTFEEARSSSDGSGVSYIDHKEAGVRTLRIGHYGYQALHWTVTAGTDVRTRFTPLTLAMGHLELARIDVDYRDRDELTGLYNRGRSGLFSEWGLVPGDTYETSPVLMYGLHWQHRFGDYARVGSTFLNQFMSFPSSTRSNAWRGDLPYEMLSPKTIRVFVADDSPEEEQTNGIAYAVNIAVEGERGGAPVRLSSDAADPDYSPALRPTVTGGEPALGGGLEAVGRGVVVYAFALPADVTARSARVTADVAGDYRIGVRQVHDYPSLDRSGNQKLVEQKWPANFSASDAAKRQAFKWYIESGEEPYYTVARSDGRGGGGANRRLVSFDYGMPTGQTLSGVDWEANLVGLQLSGEAVHNLQNFMFPVGNNLGNRRTKTALAYWGNVTKQLPGGAELGGEVYRLDPDYGGDFDSYRGGMAFHVDEQSGPGKAVNSQTQEYDLVEDNDDLDQWPDAWQQEYVIAGEAYPGWPNAGTYPGLDANSDNIPDVDRNENLLPDWQEPFLMYEADPPEFVYGVDFNNNGVADFRENDDKPDYPYPRDQKGRHAFLRLDRLGPLGKSATFGYFVNRQVAGGGRSRAAYLRYAHEYSKGSRGSIRLNYDLKKVKDNIADHTYVYTVPPDDIDVIQWINTPDTPPERAGLYRPATPDPLLMRDSWVHTGFVDSRYAGFQDIELLTSLLWVRNQQAQIGLVDGSGLLQPEDVRTRFTMVNKVDYNWVRGPLSLRPRLKHRLTREVLDTQEDPVTSTIEVMPILTSEYRLTPNTKLVAGAQGFALVPYHYVDRVNKDNTFGQTDYMGMLQVTSEYQGINTSFFVGYHRVRREYSRFEERNVKSGTIFLDIISAF
ncbi:MAG: hypothetical protein AB1505_25455, partial [Candidatus Latescibacterota bacterium]